MPEVSTFVPARFDGTKWEHIEPLMQALLERPVRSRSELETWLLDRSDLDAACSESHALLYINMTCDTEDKARQNAYADYVENVEPKAKPLAFELDKRQAALAAEHRLVESPGGDRYTVLARGTRADVELFRQENIPIQTELTLLGQKYDQLVGAMTVVFDGKEQTLPQIGRYLEATDRAVREAAWRLTAGRRLQDKETFEAIYDSMIGLRDRLGRNAGFENFIGYAYKSKHRFDYGVEDCRKFQRAVEEAVVPFMGRVDRKRAATLAATEGRPPKRTGSHDLRPWDLSVDAKGRPPLRPFNGGVELVNKSRTVFDRLDPRLSAMFRELGDGSNTRGVETGACLDLDSRKGKGPGGYQYMRDRSKRAFIFMNAAGLQRDVSTMLHEAGHAFHSVLCNDEPLLAYRHSPMEFAEVASMSMELLTMPHWGGAGSFYADEAELGRARRHQLEDSVVLLPWIATIDAFQHWVYGNPKHSRQERKAFWLELDSRYGHEVDWSGIEDVRAWLWQRQKHLFDYPFYYIEYGIAQLGALQLWLRSVETGEKAAVETYIKGLSLGGSKPLPELFTAAGLRFDFGADMVKRIVERVERELEKLPE